jgi:hypothetical protein
MIDEEIRRARKLLETLVKISGLNRQEVDRRLGQGRGYSSQVLTGRVELKYRHILTFLEVVDVDPGLFFRVLYPDFPELSRTPFPLDTAAPRQETGGRLAERLFRQLHGVRPGDRPQSPWPSSTPPISSPEPSTPSSIDPELLERRIREAIREVLGAAPPTEPDR